MEYRRRHYLRFVHRDSSDNLLPRIISVANRTLNPDALAQTLIPALQQISDEDVERISYFEFFDIFVATITENGEDIILKSEEMNESRVFNAHDFNLRELKEKGRQLAHR
jgi:hypothetical protein